MTHSKPTTISTDSVDLFSGTPGLFGGLSNERELAAQLPAEFAWQIGTRNNWMRYAGKCFFGGADTSTWSWKSPDKDVRRQQLDCLRGALSGFDLKHEQKEALCGWMLSEMLTEVPS